MEEFIVFDTSSLLELPTIEEAFRRLSLHPQHVNDNAASANADSGRSGAGRTQHNHQSRDRLTIRVIIPDLVMQELLGLSKAVDSPHRRKAADVHAFLIKLFPKRKTGAAAAAAAVSTGHPIFRVELQRSHERHRLLTQFARNNDTRILACAVFFAHHPGGQVGDDSNEGEGQDDREGHTNRSRGAAAVMTVVHEGNSGNGDSTHADQQNDDEDEGEDEKEEEVCGESPTRSNTTTTTATTATATAAATTARPASYYREERRCILVSEDHYMHVKAIPYGVTTMDYAQLKSEYGL